MYIPPEDLARPLVTHYLNNFRGLFGVPGPLRHALYHHSNSHFGKRPAAQEMTTFRSHVGAQSANYH